MYKGVMGMKLSDLLQLITENMIVRVTTHATVYGISNEITLFVFYGKYDKVDNDPMRLEAMEQTVKSIYNMDDTEIYVEI